MRRLAFTLAVFVFVGCFLSANGQVAAEEDPAAKAARRREKATRTLAVRFKVTEVISQGALSRRLPKGPIPIAPVPEKLITLNSTNRLVFEGNKVRFESDRPAVWPNSFKLSKCQLLSWSNGTINKSFYPLGYRGEGVVRGIVGKGGRPTTVIDCAPIALVFRNLSGYFGQDSIDKLRPSGETLVIEGALCSDYRPTRVSQSVRRYWIDPQRDYLVRRSQLELRQFTRQLDISYRKEAPHGWVPVSWVLEERGPEGDVLQTQTGEVLDLRINAPLAAEQLDITFPPGTRVLDTLDELPKEYVVQADGSRRWLPAEGELPEEPERPWYEGNEVLLAGVAALLVALGLTYLWQKRRKKAL